MRFLVINLILLLFCSSCSLKTTEGLRSVGVKSSEITNPYFSNQQTDYVYKAKIDVYGRYFGGILIIKKIGKDAHRVVFTTEFGSKLFDFLYEGDTFTKNYILEDLDRKLVVNTLRNDFKLLITEKIEVVEQFTSNKWEVYRSDYGKRFGFYFFKQNSEVLEKIVYTSKTKEKLEINFEASDSIAEMITIAHQSIKLNIDLAYLKKD
tara:strand:- start:470 stop:1090 length:621 start_codon:yes stop_codon:yes gene_type:complete